MKPLAPLVPMLSKLIPRLGSDHAGEVVATAAAIGRVLRNGGCDWHDLARAVTPLPKLQVKSVSDDWRTTLAFCATHIDRVKMRDREFIRSLSLGTAISPRSKGSGSRILPPG